MINDKKTTNIKYYKLQLSLVIIIKPIYLAI